MMSGSQIRQLQRNAARIAAQQNMVPFIVEREDIEDWKNRPFPGFPFPFIGDYEPRGWKQVEEYFVDSSGMGADDEPALSPRQFLEKLKPGKGYAVTEAGQFQVYVGEFEKVA